VIGSLVDNVCGLDVLKRFVAKIEKNNECWIWTAAVNDKGYPQISVGDRIVYAHRLSHELFIGPIPTGDQVHHTCLNSKCVNPDHLESTSPQRNRLLQALGVGDESKIPF